MAVTLLHISDVHFGMRDDRGDQDRITSALVKAVAKEDWSPDICIFSGDLTFSGDSAEFAQGERWLRNLVEACKPTRLFIVPGNHDVVRDDVRSIWSEAYRGIDKYAGLRTKLQSKPSHLKSFQEWHAAFKEDTQDVVISNWTDPFGSSATIEIEGMTVQLIGLNTAVLSQGDRDLGRLVQDLPTVNAALARTTPHDCTIAIGHHPLSWLAEWNRKEIEKYLKQKTGANLYLHGHNHFQFGEASGDTLGRSIAVLECGAAYHGASYPQHFSLYRLDFEKREIAPHTYVYSENSGEWVLETGTTPIVAEIPWQTLGQGHLARGPAQPRPSNKEVRAEAGATPSTPKDEDRDLVELAAWRRQRDAEIAKDKVEDLLRTLDIPDGELFHQSNRIKSVESCVRKMMAKREADPDYSIDQMPDVCGFRLVTLFQSGVPQIVRQILDATQQGALRLPPIRLNQRSGITIHSSRRDNDPLSIVGSVEEAVRTSGATCRPEHRSSATGYSSVHLVIDLDIGESGHPNWMPVEFQVRTVLEEVWGQLDHRFRYRSGRGTIGSSLWQLHLNVVKSQFDTCVQYLDLIKEMATARDDGAPVLAQPSMVTLTRPEQVLDYCRSKSVPPTLMERLAAAFALWKEADGSRQRGGEPGLFRRAADAFGFLLDPLPDMEQAQISRNDFIYIVRMEQAYMLLMSGDKADLPGAEVIYQQIISERTRDAAAIFRLGQCLRSQEKFDEAISQLNHAIEITEPEEGKEFYHGERSFIFDRARLSLGNTYFRVFSSEADVAEKARFISLAVETAEGVLTHHRSDNVRAPATNDLLYYAWEQRQLLADDDGSPGELSDERFAMLANYLEEEDRRTPPASPYEHDDTLARVYAMLGNGAAALAAASRVRDWLERAAERRSGKRFRGSSEQYTFQWVRRVSRWLVSEDERDSLVFALDICRLLANQNH